MMPPSTNYFGNLSPKQVSVILLQEKARRLRERREREDVGALPPVPSVPSLVLTRASKFSDLLAKRCRYKVYWGGRGSGKSWQIAEALIRLASCRPLTILCVREYQNSIKDSSHKLLKQTIARLGLGALFIIRNESIKSTCGAEFIFKGLTGSNNKSAAESIKSTEAVDICWVEEAQTVSKNSWNVLKNTIRKPGSEIWVSYNLINEDDPIHDFFVMNPPKDPTLLADYCVHQVNYDANPHFIGTELWKEMLADKERDYDLYEHVWLGGPLKISDAIIFGGRHSKTGEPKTIVQDFPDDLWEQAVRVNEGLDWGFANDPSAAIRNFIIGNKLYISHEAYESGIELDQYAEFVEDIPDWTKWPIKADCSNPAQISHLRRTLGWNIDGAEKWPGSVEDGIAHIKKFQQVIIHPRCPNTAKEMRQRYRYKVDRLTGEVLPIIVDKDNHACDAIRYSLDGHIQRSGELGIWARLGQSQ